MPIQASGWSPDQWIRESSMDKDEVPFIFDRFYQADESRGATPGIGLGLSIAKWIIEEHMGSVEVVTRRGRRNDFHHLDASCLCSTYRIKVY